MKKLLLLLALAYSISVNAQDDKTVTLTVSGQGKTQDEAKQVALRSAIEQAFGTFISSKTEILNDNLVKDEIVSVTNGNIQKYDVLSEVQIPDGGYVTTLKAVVSVAKLTSFCESKGVTIEIKGGLFALNIKQQILNEQGEIEAMHQMLNLLDETMQKSFDYEIKSEEPKSLDSENKNWRLHIFVWSKTNKNMEWCGNYCLNTLSAISLSDDEIENYKILNKNVFEIHIQVKNTIKTIYLRQKNSVNYLKELVQLFNYYSSKFKVLLDNEEIEQKDINGSETYFSNYWPYGTEYHGSLGKSENPEIFSLNFEEAGKIANFFSWDINRTLEQIEKMTTFRVISSNAFRAIDLDPKTESSETESNKALNKYDYITDNENLFTNQQITVLDKIISDFEKTTSNEIAIVTNESIGDFTNIKEYSVSLANKMGVGKKDKNNGILFVISKKRREIFIATGVGTEQILDNSKCQEIISETIIPYFKKNEYYLGVKAGLEESIKKWTVSKNEKIIVGEKDGNIQSTQQGGKKQ